jgi:autotransporter translocation and assembly factor TamB
MKRLYAVLGVLATMLVVAAAALGWLVGTEAGLQWTAAQAGKQLAFDNLRGRLAGEITADRLVYTADDLRIQADRVSLRAHLAALLGALSARCRLISSRANPRRRRRLPSCRCAFIWAMHGLMKSSCAAATPATWCARW